MDMNGEQRIPAAQDLVWRALNDPEILKVCIPGCQELVKSSDTQMSATVVLKVGPVSARFEGAVTLSDLDPPNSYRISGEGQGGMAGFAKGEAVVRLEADGNDTILRYEVNAQVGGKLAQLGARLIDATAKQMSAAFFRRFAEEISAQHAGHSQQAKEMGEGATERVDASAPSAAAPRPGHRRARPAPSPAEVTPDAFRHLKLVGIGLLAAAAGLAWYLFGGALSGIASRSGVGTPISADFASAVLLIMVAAIGYLFGRLNRHTDRTVLIDRDLIDALATARAERRT
ncbi:MULTISPECIES: SRPBCC family protein [Xanthobacter]|uniref:SRPBCC family protein n=1 Tax=Xanthobacter TaxID=279 RepID=UPI002022E098|nr:carbon monoxide dehydrogenase subunit G [Xanthobacter aminoxidans]MCL8382897.1 carbon monoxide dehydrogenase subunit G [Xanthobacter aminoxidans]